MITIGKKSSSAAPESDVGDLLLDCHERIRSMTALAEDPRRLAAVTPALEEAARELEHHFLGHLDREE